MNKVHRFSNNLVCFDFLNRQEIIELLTSHPTLNIYLDLTCYRPSEFYQKFPNLKGSFSALFSNPGKSIEFHSHTVDPAIVDFFAAQGFKLKNVSLFSQWFIYPRILVQIINEAYFALEDKIASQEDIDRAMKFGVNYPYGPFHWAQGKQTIVKTLLQELFNTTNDPRYQHSSLL